MDAATEHSQVLRASMIALVLGSAVAVAVVLPAEYGVDPTGAGRALGLLQLSQAAEAPGAQSAAVPTGSGSSRANTTITLESGEGTEFKLRMAEGERASFRWIASDVVHFDMHGEPTGDTSGYFESYSLGNSDAVEGKFTALFDGTHGWYWRNDTAAAVQIEVIVAGAFELADTP
ncbi:MAG: hypothetical protein AAF933_03595 [Pseudomonadota bacterium]